MLLHPVRHLTACVATAEAVVQLIIIFIQYLIGS